jgi:hypothetical protein
MGVRFSFLKTPADGLEAHLQGVVAVALLRPHAHDRAGARLDHGDRNLIPVVREHLGHPDLPPDQPFLACHV